MNARHIPVIPEVPLFGALPYVNLTYLHTSITKWAQKLGPIMRLATAGPTYIFFSDYEGIRQVKCIYHI